MKVFFGLVVGMAIGVAAYWYFTTEQGRSNLHRAEGQLESAGNSAKDVVQEKLKALNLRSNDIKDELARTGQVIRHKAKEAGQAISDATADARITGLIKSKFFADPDLSVVSISVNTTAGVVTLSGTVSSVDLIGKAIVMAMEPEGVKQVIS